MKEEVLTVHANELNKIIGTLSFKALPQEEIDRLYASIEVDVTEHSSAGKDTSLLQLTAMRAIPSS